jgi:hypothetical protein
MDYISFRFVLTMFNLLEEKVKVLKKSTLLPLLLRKDIGLGLNSQRTYYVFLNSQQNVGHGRDEPLSVCSLFF